MIRNTLLLAVIVISIYSTLASQLESYDESDITIKCPSLICPKVKCGESKCICKTGKKPTLPSTVDGIWKCISKAPCVAPLVTNPGHESYAVINTTDLTTIDFYVGTVENPRVPNPLTDIIPQRVVVSEVFSQVIAVRDEGRALVSDFSFPPINSNPDSIAMVVQDVHGPLAGFATTSLGGIMERIDALPDNIRPVDDIGLDFPDPDSRVFMFDQITTRIIREQDATNDYHKHSFYIGDTAAETLLQRIKNEGVQHGPVLIANVFTTIENTGTTTFIVKRYPHIHQSSDVTLSGFRGAYAALNGNYQILINDIKQIDRAGEDEFSDITKYEFAFSVPFDSSQLPAFDPSAHGPGFVQPDRYGPVTEDMRYNQLVSAIIEFQTRVLPELTHGRLSIGYFPLDFDNFPSTRWRTLRTFDELKEFLANGLVPTTSNQRFNGRTGSLFSGNWLTRAGLLGPISEAFSSVNPLNEPFTQLGGDPENPFSTIPGFYSTIAFNYILPGSIRYAYFRINPNTPATLPIHTRLKEEYGAIYPAFNHIGSRLEGMASPLRPFIDPPPEGDWSAYFDLGGLLPPEFAPFLPLAILSHYAGIIDPQYTGGKKIGYLYFGTFQSQPQLAPYQIMRDWQFGTPGLSIRGIEPYVQVMAGFMRYFNEEQVDDVIFDIRGNTGGRSDGWAYLFGGDRRGGNVSFSFATDNQRPPLFGQDYTQWNIIEDTVVPGEQADDGGTNFMQQYSRVALPSEARQVAGDDAVFADGRLFILVDYAALSASDQFQRTFVGDDFDGYLGNNTQMYTAGNGGSRLISYSGPSEPVAVTASSDEFLGPGGLPVPPIRWASEGGSTINYANLSSMHRIDVLAHHGRLIPPLSNHYQDTVYGEFGFIPNALPPFPNKGPTNTNIPQSYRDAWLEETIRGACAEEFVQPAVAQSMGRSPDVVTEEDAADMLSEMRENMHQFTEGLRSGKLDAYVEAVRNVGKNYERPNAWEMMKQAQEGQ